MSSEVKMVFKALLGTIAFMVITSLCIELFNLNVTGLQIRQMTKMSARQAAELFTQETYKTDGAAVGQGATSSPDLLAADGTIYADGKFYNGYSSAYMIYDYIYDNGAFAQFCNSSDGGSYYVDGAQYVISKTPRGTFKDSYTALKTMDIAFNEDYNSYLDNPSNRPNWGDSDTSNKVYMWNIYTRAKAYRELMYTPINTGIPYLDARVMNKMFRWNLGQLLSNSDSDLVQLDDAGRYYINYKGFKVYTDQAKITKYEYYVYDIENSSDKTAFKTLTGMNIDNGPNSIHTNTHYETEEEREDNFIAVVSISYGVPMTYIGITPIRNIVNYVWGSEVQGLKNYGKPVKNTGEWGEASNKVTSGADPLNYNAVADELETITSGTTSDYLSDGGNHSYNSDSDALFTNGYLTYTIVN